MSGHAGKGPGPGPGSRPPSRGMVPLPCPGLRPQAAFARSAGPRALRTALPPPARLAPKHGRGGGVLAGRGLAGRPGRCGSCPAGAAGPRRGRSGAGSGGAAGSAPGLRRPRPSQGRAPLPAALCPALAARECRRHSPAPCLSRPDFECLICARVQSWGGRCLWQAWTASPAALEGAG